ncbi:uncharacterized protein SAPINGB_P001909 [Magnusiomyces paraingens]|uniref:Fcf2 pre-rRNA processing C-terminal domain-containing protein n=1 Tax=Magnusiomyces paraingens TaxID=2606893 RepID=A0A5E8BBS7_9ASCO|nr:uncharacterized protein SAPINGB_P001909 [Saprochaete ingens]VVT48702.1 unnamed protein product [Saprochaete ingens]
MISLAASASPIESVTSSASVDSFGVSDASTMSQEPVANLEDLDLDALLASAKFKLQQRQRNKTHGSTNENTLKEIKNTISEIPKLADAEGVLNLDKNKAEDKPLINHDAAAAALVQDASKQTKKQGSLEFRTISDPVILKREAKAKRESTAGDRWFGMPKAELTPELKRDLQLLQMRSVLDPKRHYKKNTFGVGADGETAFPKYVQQGTIVEDSSEFFSARLTRKERKKTFADELLSDNQTRQYFKRKYDEILEQKNKVRKDRRRKY